MASKKGSRGVDFRLVGVGIDLTEVAKIKKVFGNNQALREGVFTAQELDASWNRKNPYPSLAAVFAVKEAVFKALGRALAGEMDWQDVGVVSGSAGKPTLRLCGKTAHLAQAMGVIRHVLSLSHTKEHGMAVVLLMAKLEE